MKTFHKVSLSSVGTMALTAVHHAYGAMIYEAPFRLHAVFFAIPVIILLFLTQRIYRRSPESRFACIAFRIFLLLTLSIPVGLIGMFEGGYNHLLKIILYFGGVSQARLDRLFPPPTYEMPDDFWFEMSGVLQFFTASYCLYQLFRLRWNPKNSKVMRV